MRISLNAIVGHVELLLDIIFVDLSERIPEVLERQEKMDIIFLA